MNVNVEIFVKALNGGFSYKAVAQDDEGNRYTVEGWAGGSQKEVERLVQHRLDAEIKKQRAVKKARADREVKAEEGMRRQEKTSRQKKTWRIFERRF